LGDKLPETSIEVIGEDGEAVFNSLKSFVQKAGKTEFIDAAIEGDKVPASLALGQTISRSVNEYIKGFERRERILARGAAQLKVEKEQKEEVRSKKGKVTRGKATGKK
jgi:hypothetical protein